MSVAIQKRTPVPSRLLAALYRAGMPEAAIAREYNTSPDEVALALSSPPEPLDVGDMELLADDDHRYELLEGELWRMSPAKKRHGRGTFHIVMHLGRYLETNPIGSVYIAEVGYRTGPRRSLLCPDAAYVCNERDEPVDEDDFFPYAPDVAVEVLSPDNTRPRVRRKAQAYLNGGGRLVWVIETRRKTVMVYRTSGTPETLSGDHLLSGDDVLPGLAVPLAHLF